MENLWDEFVVEAKEHLIKVEKHLLEMEKNPGVQEPEKIAEIFRAVHSIKGAAGFMGLKNIGALAHVMETLMSMIRSGEVKVEFRHSDALLKGRDVLMALLNDVRNSDQTTIEPTVAIIQGAIDYGMSPVIRDQMETLIAVKDASDAPTGMEIRKFDLVNLRKNYRKLFLLEYDLAEVEKKLYLSPVALVGALLAVGEILETKLDMSFLSLSQDLGTVPLKYKTLYTTDLGYEAVKNLLALSDQQVCEIVQEADITEQRPKSRESRTADRSLDTLPVQALNEDRLIQTCRLEEKTDRVRIQVEVLDQLMRLAGELVLIRNQHLRAAENFPELRRLSQRLNAVTAEIQETIMRTRMQPIGNLFSKAPRIVRELSHKLHKTIVVVIHGGEAEVDKAILEALTDPLLHLIRNCCDHGIELPQERRRRGKAAEGKIEIHAWHEAERINIRIRDDGGGIDPRQVKAKALKTRIKTESELDKMSDRDILSLLFLPGFSTMEQVTDVSGRGVGLDVVKISVEKLGGVVELSSKIGRGTEFLLKLPLTLAIIPCLMVISGEHRYAVPQMNVEEVVSLYDRDRFNKIERAGNREVFRLRNKYLAVVRLREVLSRRKPFSEAVCAEIAETCWQTAKTAADDKGFLKFAVVKAGTFRFGLVVDQIIGTEEIVVKPMHAMARQLRIYSGSAIMGDGSVALILNIEGIGIHAGLDKGAVLEAVEEKSAGITTSALEQQSSLLFTDGSTEQYALPLPLIRRVERVAAADIEQVCNREFIAVNGVSTLIVRMRQALEIRSHPDAPEMSLIIPKYIRRPVGMLIAEASEIAETPLTLNTETYIADGLLGTAIINGRMTLFPDIYRLIERVEPDYFAKRRQLSPPAAGKHILLLADAPFYRDMVRGYLEADNYLVIVAANGTEAMKKLSERRFDLIICDLELPVMNGCEFIRMLREISAYRNIPAAALIASDSELDRQKAETAGFDKSFVKFDREELLRHVAGLLNSPPSPSSGLSENQRQRGA